MLTSVKGNLILTWLMLICSVCFLVQVLQFLLKTLLTLCYHLCFVYWTTVRWWSVTMDSRILLKMCTLLAPLRIYYHWLRHTIAYYHDTLGEHNIWRCSASFVGNETSRLLANSRSALFSSGWQRSRGKFFIKIRNSFETSAILSSFHPSFRSFLKIFEWIDLWVWVPWTVSHICMCCQVRRFDAWRRDSVQT